MVFASISSLKQYLKNEFITYLFGFYNLKTEYYKERMKSLPLILRAFFQRGALNFAV